MSWELVGQIVTTTWCAGLPVICVVGVLVERVVSAPRAPRHKFVTVIEEQDTKPAKRAEMH